MPQFDPEQLDDIKKQLPNAVHNLRACLGCRIILAKEQFFQMGCPNCKGALSMKESEGRVLACTTPHYHGFVSNIRPGAFVSRYLGLEKRPPGCYALAVQGTIPDSILNEGSEYEPSEFGEEEENKEAERSDAESAALASPKSPAEKRPATKDISSPSPNKKQRTTDAPKLEASSASASDTPAGAPATPAGPEPPTPAGVPHTPAGVPPAAPDTPAGTAPHTPGPAEIESAATQTQEPEPSAPATAADEELKTRESLQAEPAAPVSEQASNAGASPEKEDQNANEASPAAAELILSLEDDNEFA
eukprot:TRINITY_DN90553_c0_g1_i1.p1 TRINITY_DN90553_c0_g1~~TRINITY_DN90553_c0_g1_i1.p1  ORF type:complete len:304 (+),score=73.52 TRINITY_DN90553_c0_g1_i1:44-955(+)